MVETFQADKEGCYSPIQRDDNKDGIQDAYDEIGVDVAEMNETIELLLDEKTYNKINKYGRVVEKKVENNDIKYVYHLKMGDDIEKYYDLNGNKIININNEPINFFIEHPSHKIINLLQNKLTYSFLLNLNQ